MLVRPDEKTPIARLLTFLEHGERMAHDCAKAQAALSDDSGTRSFLLSQARQEAMHARVFQGAIAWLARGGTHSRSQRDLLVGLLVYNAAVLIPLFYAGGIRGVYGVLLWPAVLYHAALAAWCIACLRA